MVRSSVGLAFVWILAPALALGGDDPAVARRVAEARATLASANADANDRRRAAATLFDLDATTLVESLRNSRDDALVLAILDAIATGADVENSGFVLTGVVFSLLRDPARKDVFTRAQATLRAMDRADRALKLPPDHRVRQELHSRIRTGDPESVRLAATVLADLGDLAAADVLLEVLERTAGHGPLADAAGDGLERLLFKTYGSDAAAWRAHLDDLRRRGLDSYVAVLRDSIVAERASADQELLQLRIALDEDDPVALIADLGHRLPAVRRFAAETLTRRVNEWDVEPAREVAITGLRRDLAYSDVAVALLGLIDAIDRKSPRAGPDPLRDAVMVLAIESGDPAILAAAAKAVPANPPPEIATAILVALGEVGAQTLTPDSRTALVEAVGKLRLVAAREVLERLLSVDESADVRTAIVGALGAIGDPAARGALERALAEDKQWRVRRRAAKELAALAPATPALLKALSDSRPEVRGEVALALSGTVPVSAEVVAALKERLAVEQPPLPELVRAVGLSRDPSAIEALCAVAGRIASPSSSAPPADLAAADLVVRELKGAFDLLCGDDLAAWNAVADSLLKIDRPALAVFALSQPVRILLARSGAASANGGTGATGSAPNGNGDLAGGNVTPQESSAALEPLLQARLALAEAALAANDLALAESVTADALSGAKPGAVRRRLQLGRASALCRLERIPEALAIYDELLGARGANAADDAERRAAIVGAARAHDRAGDYAAVVKLLRGAIDLDVEIQLLLARAERRTGDPAGALDRIEKLRTALPPSDSLFDLELRIEFVEALLDRGETARAAAVELPDPATLAKDAPVALVEALSAARKRRG